MQLIDSIIWKEHVEKIVIINLEKDDDVIFEIDGVAKEIFIGLFSDQKSLEEIKESMLQRYKVDSETLTQDIDKLLLKFKNLDLLKK